MLLITSQGIFVLCVLHWGDHFDRKFSKTILNTEHKNIFVVTEGLHQYSSNIIRNGSLK
jgi:hypothetical protein